LERKIVTRVFVCWLIAVALLTIAGCDCKPHSKETTTDAAMPGSGVPELPVPEDYELAVEKAINEKNYEKVLLSVEAELETSTKK
jgi:hypothetical protein